MWFEPDDIINKQRLFNFIVGARGCGKTFGCQKYIGKQKLKDNTYEAIWLRRYDVDRAECKRNFFADLERHNIFKDTTFEIKGDTGYMNDMPLIRFSALSIDGRRRGLNCANVRLIIFDEFLIQNNQRYLKDEFTYFLSYYDSVARPNDPSRKRVPVLFLGNAMTIINPYFDGFNIKLVNGKYSTNHVYAEQLKDREFTEHSSSTEFAEAIKHTSYFNHAINNEFMYDDDSFIEKKSKNSRYLCGLVYDGRTIGVWVDWIEGKIWLTEQYDPSSNFVYTIGNANAKPNILTAKYFKKTHFYEYISNAFNTGSLYFSSLKIKNDWRSIVNIINM